MKELFYTEFCLSLKENGIRLDNQIFKAILWATMGIDYYDLTREQAVKESSEKYNVNQVELNRIMDQVGYIMPEERKLLGSLTRPFKRFNEEEKE